ncbi:MAG: ATP-dependent helicase [Rubrobacteraceae bacterium]
MGRVKAGRQHTDEQRKVITLEQGPARVLAGAGSGKTHTMTELIGRRVRDHEEGMGGAAPNRILAITFTVKAAEEMRQRIIERIGESALDLTVSNFHQLAYKIARENAVTLGMEPDAPLLRRGRAWLMVLDDLAAGDLSLRRLDLSNPARAAERALTLLSAAKNDLVGLQSLRERTELDLANPAATDEMRTCFEERLDLVTLAERFEEKRKESGMLMYQDMVEMAVSVLSDPVRGEPYRDRYDLVVVDEFQDTNPGQMRLVELLADNDLSKVVVIGDDLQSIFNFQGAAIRNIQRFEEHAGKAVGESTYSLTTNFRSATRILDLANHIANFVHPENSPDAPKVLSPREDAPVGGIEAFVGVTDAEEAAEIAERVRGIVAEGGSYASRAVLIRKWSQAPSFLHALSEAGVPCEVVKGGDLLSRPEVRHLMDYLRLVARPGGVGAALLRVLSRHPRLLSDGDLRAVFEHGRGFWAALSDPESVENLSDEARNRLLRLRDVLARLEGELSAAESLGDFVERTIEVVGLGREVRSAPGAEAKLAVRFLETVVEVADEFGKVGRLEEFLRYVEVSEGSAASENVEPPEAASEAVVLTTIHSAKGLEFDHVFVPGLSKGVFPNDWRSPESPLKHAHVLPPSLKPDPDSEAKAAYDALDAEGLKKALKREADEEEGRLFYVAATRARESLTLSRACYYGANKGTKNPGVFWEMTQGTGGVPDAPEPELPESNPNLQAPEERERPPADPFPLEASAGSMADEVAVAKKLGVVGWEDELHRLREDVRAIPEVERPAHILPASETHSPSSLMDFEVCPRRYYHTHVFLVPDLFLRGGESRDYGTAFHAWIESGMQGDPPSGPESPEKPEESPGCAPKVPLRETEYGKKVSTYPLHEGHEPPASGPVRMVEVPFTIEVDGSEIKGRIDAIFVDEDGTFHIIDWKSGWPNDSYKKRLQLPIYALAANKLWNVPPENIRLAYVFAGGEKVSIEIGENFLEEAGEKVRRLLGEIRVGRFEPTPSKYACKFCPVFGIGIEGCPKSEAEIPEG